MQNSTIMRARTALLLTVSMVAPYSASAKPPFLAAFTAEYPAVVGTRLESCNVCHTTPPRRNPYGTDFNLAGRFFPAIESVDSDGDGVDNITEIRALSFPGDASDLPQTPTAATPTPTSTPLPTGTIVEGSCAGDCDGDGAVAVNELVLAVNIALGNAAADECSSVDADGDGQVTISELLTAVNRALSGCAGP